MQQEKITKVIIMNKSLEEYNRQQQPKLYTQS